MKRLPLRRLALAAGATVSADATKEQLVNVLKGMNVNPMDPQWGMKWQQVTMDHPTEGRCVELYPVETPNQSSRMQLDSEAELRVRLAKQQEEHAEEKKEDESKIEELEKTIGQLQSMLTQIIEKETERKPSFPVEKLVPWQLVQMCKEMGIYQKGMSSDEMKAAILGENTAQRGQ